MSEPGGDSRPHLRPVPPAAAADAAGGASETAASPEPAAPVSESSGGWLLYVAIGLGLAALGCAIGWSLAARDADRLGAALGRTEAELRATSADLEAAERRLDAYSGHVTAARRRVAGLLAELGELDSFLGRDPAAPTPPPAREPSDAAPPAPAAEPPAGL